MKKYRCYYLNDFRDDYDALSKEDADGDWYSADDVDARIAELERRLTFAEDAAAKGELARQNAGGMEMRISELEKALRWILENEVYFDTGNASFYEYLGQGEIHRPIVPIEVLSVVRSLMVSETK